MFVITYVTKSFITIANYLHVHLLPSSCHQVHKIKKENEDITNLNFSTTFRMYCLILYFLKRFIIKYMALIFFALLRALAPLHIYNITHIDFKQRFRYSIYVTWYIMALGSTETHPGTKTPGGIMKFTKLVKKDYLLLLNIIYLVSI